MDLPLGYDRGHRRGAAPHFHRTFSEAFYVLDGRISLYDGVAWREGRGGDFLYVPEGGIHAFRNPGEDRTEFMARYDQFEPS